MLYFLLIFIVVFDIFFYRYKNLQKFVIACNFVFLWLILGWARGAYDVEIGISRYMYPERYKSFTEPVFNAIINLGYLLKLDYRTFYAIVSFFEIFLLVRFVRKYSNYPCLVLMLFILYPMSYVFTLTRNILAYTIVLCVGIDILLQKEKNYEIKYVIVILISTMIHYSSIFFIVYIIVDKLNINQTKWFTTIGIILLSSYSIVLKIISVFSSFINAEKIGNIMRNSVGHGLFGRIASSLIIFIVFFVIYNLLKNRYEKGVNENWSEEKSTLVYKINYINLLAIPLIIFYAIGFSRIFVLTMPLYYIAIFNMIGNVNRSKITVNQFYAILLVLMCIVVENYGLYNTEEMRSVSLRPMYEQNEFLERVGEFFGK